MLKHALATAALVCMALQSSATYATQCNNNGIELKEPALCSKAFYFEGPCGSRLYPREWGDVRMVAGAWEKTSIRILAVSADVILSGQRSAVTGELFVGNSWNADEMTPIIRGVGGPLDQNGTVYVPLHAEQHFPPDRGMQFPAGKDWHSVHIDTHLTCYPDAAYYSGYLTVWYFLDP